MYDPVAKKVQAEHPQWMFRQCWDWLKKKRPELFSYHSLDKPEDRKAALNREHVVWTPATRVWACHFLRPSGKKESAKISEELSDGLCL